MLSGVPPLFSVMLSEVKHPHWIPHCVRNDKKVSGMTRSVMLNEGKHPCTGFLATLGMTEKVLGTSVLAI